MFVIAPAFYVSVARFAGPVAYSPRALRSPRQVRQIIKMNVYRGHVASAVPDVNFVRAVDGKLADRFILDVGMQRPEREQILIQQIEEREPLGARYRDRFDRQHVIGNFADQFPARGFVGGFDQRIRAHFRDEFLRRERATIAAGAKFIFPLPEISVVGAEPTAKRDR